MSKVSSNGNNNDSNNNDNKKVHICSSKIQKKTKALNYNRDCK